MSKSVDNNGFDYVDLELPSGTLWATCNVGAHKPSDYGLYFQWGDIQGYYEEQVGYDKGNKWFAIDYSDYRWGRCPKFTKYTKRGATLELEDDAANNYMGGDWHIPTPKQIQELLDNTTSKWTKLDDGIEGMTFTSKNGKSIFISAAGGVWDGGVFDKGYYGYIWSSTLRKGSTIFAQDLNFDPDSPILGYASRCGGHPIRGVIG